MNALNLLCAFSYAVFLLLYTTLTSIFRLLVPHKYRSKSVQNEIVLITGAASGIGKLLAKKFGQLGAQLVLVDVNQLANEQTADELRAMGARVSAFSCDLSNRDEIYRVADQIKKSVGDVTFLINNAGIVIGKKFLDTSDEENERTMKVNVNAHFWLAKAFLPKMIEKNHGHVVTIASLAGLFGSAGLCDYCASKFAAVGFEESLRNELIRLDKNGVYTTVVCPYYINTGMFEGVQSSLIPILEPEYVAEKIVEAVLTNQRVLILPRLMYFVYFLKSFASTDAAHYFSMNLLRTNHAMDYFVGRRRKAE